MHVTKLYEFLKHAGTQDQKLKASRASTQPTLVQSWSCLTNFLSLRYRAIWPKPSWFTYCPVETYQVGGTAESCSTRPSVLRNHPTFEAETSVLDLPSSLQVNENTCEVLVQAWYDDYVYRSGTNARNASILQGDIARKIETWELDNSCLSCAIVISIPAVGYNELHANHIAYDRIYQSPRSHSWYFIITVWIQTRSTRDRSVTREIVW